MKRLTVLLAACVLLLAGCGGQGTPVRLTTRPLIAARDTHLASIGGRLRTAQNPTVGEVLTSTTGTFNNSPSSYSYQWQDCTGGTCTNINGATSSSYTIQAGDVGDTIQVVVTAFNSGRGSATQTSTPTGLVAPNANYYVGQSSAGSGNGSSCANEEPATWFNNTSNWGTSAGQIGPGKIVGLCGTITSQLLIGGSSNTNGSGTSGNPITIYWESGASLAPAECPGTGCINTQGNDYLTFDGGNNGASIDPTAMGTGLADENASGTGIYAEGSGECNSCTFKNLTIENLYQHQPPTNFTGSLSNGSPTVTGVSSFTGLYVGLSIGDGSGGCIPAPGNNPTTITAINTGLNQLTMSNNATCTPGSNPEALVASDYDSGDHTLDNAIRWYGSNVTVADNTLHDVGWALFSQWQSGDTNNQIYGNNIYNVDHGMALTGPNGTVTGVYVYDNHIHDFATWDAITSQGGLPNHHDGIHCFGPTNGTTYSGFYIYDNRFDGTLGVAGPTSPLFIEGNFGTGTPCANSSSTVDVFNNIMTSTDAVPSNDYIQTSQGAGGVYNNTVIGYSNSIVLGGCGKYSGGPNGGTIAWQNNIQDNCNTLMSGLTSGTTGTYASGSPDYNLYANGGSNSFGCNASTYTFGQFSSWQSCMSADSHSTTTTTPDVNADGSLQAGSPAAGAGVNLTSSVCAGFPTSPVNVQSSCDTTYTGPPAGGGAGTTTTGSARPSSGAWNIGAY